MVPYPDPVFSTCRELRLLGKDHAMRLEYVKCQAFPLHAACTDRRYIKVLGDLIHVYDMEKIVDDRDDDGLTTLHVACTLGIK
jgi:hypothetical protein